MPKSPKPVGLQNRHNTQKEKADRAAREKALKGSDNSVYSIPTELKLKREKEIYINLVNELKASGILSNLDIPILIQTVDSIIKMEDAKKSIKKYGMVQEKVDGTLSKNPAITIYKDYQTIYYQCCLQLGLSPGSRSKLAGINVQVQKEKDDPLLTVLRGGKSNDKAASGV